MEHTAHIEAARCRDLAAAMRQDATRTEIPGFAARLLRGAEDLERQAVVLGGWVPLFF